MRMQPAILPKIREIVLWAALMVLATSPHLLSSISLRPGSRTRGVHLRRSISDDGPDLTNQTVCTPDVIARMERAGALRESCSATS